MLKGNVFINARTNLLNAVLQNRLQAMERDQQSWALFAAMSTVCETERTKRTDT